MARKRIVITICDICEREADVAKVEIHIAASLRRLDLCAECIEPVQEVFKKGQRPQARKRRKPAEAPKTASGRVSTIEEIEASKALKAS